MLKKILSYLLPINVYKQQSSVSKNLEVTWANGELVLDSKNANYSYGSLQRILRKGLESIGFDTVLKTKHILILGVAGGSVIKTLSDEIGFKGKITGVEIDPEVLQIANSYFGLNKIPNLEIIVDDASKYVLKDKNKYGLIIVDIFQDTTMPDFLFEDSFQKSICELLEEKGIILFNTMCITNKDSLRNKKYVANINLKLYNLRTIPRVERYNELIIIEKK
ncbi:spermidine synthase [Flavobacterium microcysteis]|uniref:Methyltransferase domain-containing protein n=1 Tax=Flavobacterium microcysteis TaxID=2596891 RepID=A0A501QDA4_9FLAO|nr:fused MFS/spermidine synthase [Flavobacterium microcysteis]TPD70418.1 methyltransferase domain-containing protein [Flavobacterium microcysteis]